MHYEMLEQSKWSEMKELTGDLRIPESASAVAAICRTPGGKIVGALFAQLVIHMEPLVLRSPNINFKRLHKLVEKELTGQGYYAFAPDSTIEGMCKMVGMSELPWKVFVKE